MQSDDMAVEEIRLFIETLEGIGSTIKSDHIMNLLEEISGKLPEDKEKMLNVAAKYQELSDSEKLIFRIGRRGGVYHSTDDLKRSPSTYQKIRDLIQELESKEGIEGVEKFITDMVDRYI